MQPLKPYTISLEVRRQDGSHVGSSTWEFRTGILDTKLVSFLMQLFTSSLASLSMKEEKDVDSLHRDLLNEESDLWSKFFGQTN